MGCAAPRALRDALLPDDEQSFHGGHRQRVSSTACSRATSTLRWWTSSPTPTDSGLRTGRWATWFAA